MSTEAMHLLMAHAFELGFRRYEWKCDALNAPSRRAAERLGFTFEGIFRQAIHYKGRNRDTAWYSITDDEWPAIREAQRAWLQPENFDADGRQRRSLETLRSTRQPRMNKAPASMTDTAPPKEQITFEDLVKIDIRVGTILEVSDIAESKKLVRLKVDLGFATRTVVVGMKQERANPREVEGSQALFVVNLPPRKMAGIVSEAMLFDVGYSDKIVPALAIPERRVPNGTRAG